MTYELIVTPLVKFKVEGKSVDDSGKESVFAFTLTAERLASDEEAQQVADAVRAAERAGSKTPIADVMLPKLRNWGDVTSAGAEVPFTPEGARALLARKGMAVLAYLTYLRESGVKEKNS